MKKLLALLVAGLVAVFAVSCGGTGKSGNSGKEVTTILINEGSGIDDKSFNAAAWRGITSFYGDTPENPTQRNVLYKDIFASTPDLRTPNTKLASDEAPSLIIATGFTFSDALVEVAPLYPNQKYLIIDDNNVNQPNVREAIFAEHEGSFLVGAAVALKAIEDGIENPKFGFIGGMPGSVITRFEVGFVQGVLSVLPNAEIFDYYANNWGAPELGKTQAKAWYDQGVYAIFTAAGGTGNGAIAQAKEYRAAGKNVWVIGVDSDQYEDGIFANGESAVITSMVKKVETPVIDTLNMIKNGNFTGGTIVYNLALDGVDYSKKNSHLSTAITTKLDAIKADIASGKTVVFGSLASALANNAVPKNLKAKD